MFRSSNLADVSLFSSMRRKAQKGASWYWFFVAIPKKRMNSALSENMFESLLAQHFFWKVFVLKSKSILGILEEKFCKFWNWNFLIEIRVGIGLLRCIFVGHTKFVVWPKQWDSIYDKCVQLFKNLEIKFGCLKIFVKDIQFNKFIT